MDASTGAIKKTGILNYTVVIHGDDSDNEEGITRVSYKLKIKHVCPSCYNSLKSDIMKRLLKPRFYADICNQCYHKSIQQPYANICSVCSRYNKICCRCLDPYDELGENPLKTVLNSKIRKLLRALPENLFREALKFVYRKWNAYLDGSITANKIRKNLVKRLNYLQTTYYDNL